MVEAIGLDSASRDSVNTQGWGVEETVSKLWKTPVSQREDRVIGRLRRRLLTCLRQTPVSGSVTVWRVVGGRFCMLCVYLCSAFQGLGLESDQLG